MIKELNEIFDNVLEYATQNQVCRRKAVGCAAVIIDDYDYTKRGLVRKCAPKALVMEHNGPSRMGAECLNLVGNCGCSHAESRAVLSVLENYCEDDKLILICTYSPCTTCANIIIDSGLFGGVIYDILTEHDVRGKTFLEDAMPVMTRTELTYLEDETVIDKIKKWISSSSS